MRAKNKRYTLKVLFNEGILDDLISNFEKYQEEQAAEWLRAMESKRPGQILPAGFKKDGSPESMIIAASTTAYILGKSIQTVLEAQSSVESALDSVSTEASDKGEEFVKASAQVYKQISEGLGPAVGWLQHEDLSVASKRLKNIGKDLEAKTVSDSIKKMAAAIDRIDSLNVQSEIRKVMESDAAKEIFEKSKEKNMSKAKELSEEGLENLKNADKAVEFLNSLPEKLSKIDEVMDQMEARPDVGQTASIQSSMFESLIREYTSCIIKNGEKQRGS